MTLSKSGLTLGTSVVICGTALVFIRAISAQFAAGTVTANHPVFGLIAALLISASAWLMMIRPIETVSAQAQKPLWLMALIVLGIGLRLMFWDSVSIYEDDWRRYLWDGAMLANGFDPFLYSPTDIHDAAQVGASSAPDLAARAVLSRDAGHFAGTLNNPDLTTIYPPIAQLAFALAYLIDPFDLDGLRAVFLLADGLGLWLMIMGLRRFGRAPLWAMLYWLNPILIFTTYSGGHMDVLLTAPLMAALIWAVRRPVVAGAALAIAAAIKFWPLMLAPILFRHWRARPVKLAALAAWVGGLSLILLLPLLMAAAPNSGLGAYSASWTNSSFLFPLLREGLGLGLGAPDIAARIIVALTLIGLSLWLGLLARDERAAVPYHLLLMSSAFLMLSPTGYPWYLIWILMFIPFAPRLWAAALFIGAGSYYVRFWLGEAGHYTLYTHALVPLWYGVPLALFLLRGRHA